MEQGIFSVDDINRFFREQDETIQRALPIAEAEALIWGVSKELIEQLKQAATRTQVSNTWFTVKVLRMAMNSECFSATYVIQSIINADDPFAQMNVLEGDIYFR